MAKNGNVAHPGKKLSLHLTRIRPNFWVFQEKSPIFGSNPIELWFRGGKIKSLRSILASGPEQNKPKLLK
jgi:hypothetical protein